MNLSIVPGERIALVGENGAGKTTITKLLARLYDPSEGRILLDGLDLREYDLASLREAIGVIFQAAGIACFVINLIYSYVKGKKAGDDPWDAWTLEWSRASSPPPVRSRRPLWDLKHPEAPDWVHEQ